MIAELDMIASIWRTGTHQGFECLALVSDLPGGLWVRGRRLIHRRKIECRVGGTTRTELDDRVGINRHRGLVDRMEKSLQTFDRFLGALVMMRGVVTGRDVIEVLAIDLEAGKAPLADKSSNQLLRVLHRGRIPGAQIEAVPPGYVLRRAVLVQ